MTRIVCAKISDVLYDELQLAVVNSRETETALVKKALNEILSECVSTGKVDPVVIDSHLRHKFCVRLDDKTYDTLMYCCTLTKLYKSELLRAAIWRAVEEG